MSKSCSTLVATEEEISNLSAFNVQADTLRTINVSLTIGLAAHVRRACGCTLMI